MEDHDSLTSYHKSADDLLQSGVINKLEYDTFILFEHSDLGKEFLKLVIDEMFYETPEGVDRDLLSWYEGRRSVFRQIKLKINEIHKKIKGFEHDR